MVIPYSHNTFISHADDSIYNLPALINEEGEILMQLVEGVGDEHYDYPQVNWNQELLDEKFFDDVYLALKEYCK